MTSAPDQPHRGFHGPKCWLFTAIAGLSGGFLLAWLIPPAIENSVPIVPLWLVAPFAMLLASIALMPFIHRTFWHHHFPDFAFALGGLVAGYYLFGFNIKDATGHVYGTSHLTHAIVEYYAFIALVGGLGTIFCVRAMRRREALG